MERLTTVSFTFGTHLKKHLVLCLTLCPLALYAADISIHFIGLNDELAENVRAHLMQRKDDDAYSVRRRLVSAVKDGIKPFGYYRPRVKIDLVRADSGDVTSVNVIVDPGERIHLTEPHLNLQGPLTKETEFDLAVQQIPKAGSPLLHSDYEQFKGSVQALALELGYFDGKFSKHSLKVSPREGTAYWDLAYDSGKRYKFGKVNCQN